MAYAGEFTGERFRLGTKPKWNKKERRQLGIPKDEIKIIQIAQGVVRYKGKEKFINRTGEIINSTFNPQDGYLYLTTVTGKEYKVPYRS